MDNATPIALARRLCCYQIERAATRRRCVAHHENCPINVNMRNVLRFLLFLVFVPVSASLARAAAPEDRAPLSDRPAVAGKVIRVGASREIRTLRAAAKIARDGDTIEVDSGDYEGDSAVWTQNDLVIRGIGTRPRLVADGVNAAEGKGIFVIKGNDVTIDNLGFFGARVRDRNGAGIRLDRGRLKVIRCVFEGNENGILTSNNPSVELLVSDSTFLNNGAGDGYSHHLYAGRIAALEVRGTYFGPARKGHLLKSRAQTTSVLYSRLTGEDGSSSYEIDVPNGGSFRAVGNLIQQGNQTENHTLISYGAEGYKWTTNHAQIAFNTLVNDRAQGGVFIQMRSGAADAVISNNILVGRGALDVKAPASIERNVQARAVDFADPSKFDYRLRVGSKLVGTAGAAGSFNKEDRPSSEYRHLAAPNELVDLTELTPLSPGAFQRLTR